MELWELANWTLAKAILDVLVVSYLIYKTLLLVRGTRAEYVLKGLAVIGVIYIGSRVLGLVTLNWLLGNFLGSVILVIVVLFQDDLRRGLSKVGLIPGLGAEVSGAIETSLREVARAAVELSSRRIGALIVLRREVGLDEYVEQAVEVDALVSRELLISIFLRTSPLHDGAVIIDGRRIAAAGAVLPLSFNPSLSSALGTRHRAAAGLSERTDAIVVVVSEETGTISLVREGRVTRNLAEDELYESLYRATVYRMQRRASRKAKKPSVGKLIAGKDKAAAKGKDNSSENGAISAAKDENAAIDETSVGDELAVKDGPAVEKGAAGEEGAVQDGGGS